MRSVTIGSENSSLVNVTRYRPEYSAFFEIPLPVTAELIKMVQYRNSGCHSGKVERDSEERVREQEAAGSCVNSKTARSRVFIQ
jgi:hypothetical protein